jgi:hypothetical protein
MLSKPRVDAVGQHVANVTSAPGVPNVLSADTSMVLLKE